MERLDQRELQATEMLTGLKDLEATIAEQLKGDKIVLGLRASKGIYLIGLFFLLISSPSSTIIVGLFATVLYKSSELKDYHR